MSEPIDHHFVPVFYLSRWTGADGKVAVHAHKGGRVVVSRLRPRSTGFEPELYSLASVDDSKRQTLEKDFFSRQIDDRAAPVLSELVEQRVGSLTNEQRVIFSHFLMSLRARHPGAVQKGRIKGAQELRRHLERNPEEYEKIRTDNDPATLVEAAEHFMPVRTANFGLGVLQAVIVHPEVGERVFTSRWSVVNFSYAQEPWTLLTSDRPCLLEGNLMGRGAFMVALPLSPTKLFVACDSVVTERRARQLSPDVLLDRVNRTVISSAAKYIYSVDDRYLPLVEEVLRQREHGAKAESL
jgi:Protein of unknown function (DUF4238)